jgi:hypothetical protein
MNWRSLLVSFLALFLALLIFNPLDAVGKPDVTRHEATFLGGAVNMHIEWQSPNPIVTVRISIANKQQDLKVDLYDNRRNPSGYAGEVNVTIGLDWIPNQPFNYVIQLEDELRMKSALVTGKVKVPPPQQPGMQFQPQQTIPQQTQQPGLQSGTPPGTQAGTQPGGKQAGSLIVIIEPQNIANSGAMWRVGNSQWMKSGETVSSIPVGIYTVEFQEVQNFTKPENQKVMIEGGQTLTLNGIYNSK